MSTAVAQQVGVAPEQSAGWVQLIVSTGSQLSAQPRVWADGSEQQTWLPEQGSVGQPTGGEDVALELVVPALDDGDVVVVLEAVGVVLDAPLVEVELDPVDAEVPGAVVVVVEEPLAVGVLLPPEVPMVEEPPERELLDAWLEDPPEVLDPFELLLSPEL